METSENAAQVRLLRGRINVLASTMRLFAGATANYEELLLTIAKRVAAELPNICVVQILRPDGATLEPVAVCATDPAAFARIEALGAKPIVVANHALYRRVLRTGEPVLVPKIDPAEHRRQVSTAHADVVSSLQLHSGLVVALRAQGRTLGTLSLSRHDPALPPFDEDDKEFAQTIADQAALAITNAGLLESSGRELGVVATREALERAALVDSLIESVGDAVLATDSAGRLLVANEAARRTFAGVESGVVMHPDWGSPQNAKGSDGSLVPPELGPLRRGLQGENTDGLTLSLALWPSMQIRWVEASGRPVRDPSGSVVAAVAVFRDVTQSKTAILDLERARAELAKQAAELRAASITDELTGLLNRRGFMLVANQEMKRAIRNNRKLVLVFIDVDQMKSINDRFGHKMGDRALADAASLLRGVFRDSDVFARLGGDEFVVFAIDAIDTSGPTFVRRLDEALAVYNVSSSPFSLSLSVGATVFDPRESQVTLEDLLSRADERMYEQKKHGISGSTPRSARTVKGSESNTEDEPGDGVVRTSSRPR